MKYVDRKADRNADPKLNSAGFFFNFALLHIRRFIIEYILRLYMVPLFIFGHYAYYTFIIVFLIITNASMLNCVLLFYNSYVNTYFNNEIPFISRVK